LDRRDVASGGDALRWLVTSSRERGSAIHPTNIAWGKNTSPVLAGVQLAALGPILHPSDQLRYRIGTPLPTHPAPGTTHIAALARRLPAMLWPAWSLPLSVAGCHQRQLSPALSIAILLVNSRLNLDEAANLIKSPIDGPAVSRVLQLLEKHNRWHSIRAALIRMSDYLAEHDVSIDYQRRRQLDYRMLLPDKVWAQICRDTATPGPQPIRAKIARCFLFERLSALPAAGAPSAHADSAFRGKVADFPQHITPELLAALQQHANKFLAGQGIGGEPVTWTPPADLLDGLDLPGPDPEEVDVCELHSLIRGGGIKIGTAATRLNTSLDTVRHLLEIHPAPRTAPAGNHVTAVHNRAYCLAKAALPPDRLLDQYQRQQMSLRDIAATVGVSRQTIARLARDYDLPLREPQQIARTTVDRDWLYDQYVNKRRALPDIAEEAGMSTSNMARWAKTYAIPMRGRGGPSHTASLAAQCAVAEAPELIRPALAGIGGWERLQRFAAASRYATLGGAAEALGVGKAALVTQINRIERELDKKLLHRAERGRPMELTEDGARVAAAVWATYSRGDPRPRSFMSSPMRPSSNARVLAVLMTSARSGSHGVGGTGPPAGVVGLDAR
ncbi:MAG: Bacterial regulatory helix-turn-helix protein lysR family, partial [Mycobacterium sp.]|nr:Bacterial regulatory helix-turn-helix protein lysR family [Mycobacterium sp.]